MRTVFDDGSPGRVLFPADHPPTAFDADWSPDGETLAVHVFNRSFFSDRLVLLEVDTGTRSLVIRAADMIAAGVTAMEFRASAEDVSRMSHAHPTYMEAVKEACLAATANRPIHL